MRVLLTGARGGTPAWADAAAEDYGRRIHRYFPWEERLWKPAEEQRYWQSVPPRTRVILLDERGQDLDSPGLARWIDGAATDGVMCLHFAVGAAYGHPDAARAAAWRQLRLSPMVLNQAVARVMIVEQIYRACTIRAGEPYHHG